MINKVEPRTLPGFMELNPNDQLIFNKLMDIIKNTYEKYAFYPLDTPVIEYSNVLLAKAGGETEKQIYRFTKGDTDLSLRFDLTVPLAKYVSKNYNELSFPFKRYQIGKVYRGERQQRGRFREFYQCDIDVIGNEDLSSYYDAEIPRIIYDIFKSLNIADFTIKINNRKILTGFFLNLEIKNYNDVLRIIDKIDKIGTENVIFELEKMDISIDSIKKIIKFISIKGTNDEILKKLNSMNITNETYLTGIEELNLVINNLKLMNVAEDNFNIDLTIARGLDYYTGTVYETILKDYREIGSVCSGGRYDNLAGFYTDKKLPGVGISIGLTRLFYQLKEVGLLNNFKIEVAKVVIIPFNKDCYNYSFKVTDVLRKNNIKTDICYLDKFKSKMKYANNIGAKYAILIGEDEISSNTVSIKNMEIGNQDKIEFDKIIEYINK